jgi:hypothetical protein
MERRPIPQIGPNIQIASPSDVDGVPRTPMAIWFSPPFHRTPFLQT